MIGKLINLIFIISFSIWHLMKRSTCSNLQVLLILISFLMCVSCINLCMAWNKLLEHSTLSLVIIFSLLAFMLLRLTHHYSFCLWMMIFFLSGSNSILLHQLIQLLSLEFKLRDLRVVHYFLGIEVHPTTMGIMLWKYKYILDILH
jgi:hypothetical protein